MPGEFRICPEMADGSICCTIWGTGKFEDVTARFPAFRGRRWDAGGVFCGRSARARATRDIFLSPTIMGVSETLFQTRAGKRFREVGEKTGVGYAPQERNERLLRRHHEQWPLRPSMSPISRNRVSCFRGNNLWVPKEETSGDGIKYENYANAMGVDLGGWSFWRAVRRNPEQRWAGSTSIW